MLSIGTVRTSNNKEAFKEDLKEILVQLKEKKVSNSPKKSI
jgi:hypothetical protein